MWEAALLPQQNREREFSSDERCISRGILSLAYHLTYIVTQSPNPLTPEPVRLGSTSGSMTLCESLSFSVLQCPCV